MKFFPRMGRVIKPLVNFPLWMNAKQLKADGRQLKDLAKATFKKPEKNHRVETFEQAVGRLGLEKTDITKKMKTFLWQAIAYAVIALGLFAYSIWLISGGFVFSSLLALVLSGLAGVKAMQVHFFYFQIKQQRLGCSIREWFGYCLKGMGLKNKMVAKSK